MVSVWALVMSVAGVAAAYGVWKILEHAEREWLLYRQNAKRVQQELTWCRENYTNLRRRLEFLETAVGPLEDGSTVIYRNAQGNIVRADIALHYEGEHDYVGSDDLSDK